MREKFARFMAGRYGMDTMGRFTIGLALFSCYQLHFYQPDY